MERTAGTADAAVAGAPDALTFRFADPEHRLAGVRLRQAAGIPHDRLDFESNGAGWVLTVPRPPVQRLEYLLELRHRDGGTELVCDPENPRRVGGAFGDKSVVEWPGYAEPAWLRWDGPLETSREFVVPAPRLRGGVPVRTWSPLTPTNRVLVAHDGPEYDRYASLTQYSAAMVQAGLVPPHHLVLLAPGDRNEWYSANPDYARTLTGTVLPRVHAALGTSGPVVGMGASLGALAMLHAQRGYPATFDGLFLQSGSFFRPTYDGHESGFSRYIRLVRFVGRVVRERAGPPGRTSIRPVRTVLTCGQAEENRHNNREMARALRRQGYPVELAEVPDAHNFTGWRDAFHPHLTGLLRAVWGDEDAPALG
jgi:enterochelin esterase family protein